MTFRIRKRGKLTYYYQDEHPIFSSLVTEQQPDGDLKIHFAGLTGGYSAKGVLGLDELVTMDPHREIPLVFRRWGGAGGPPRERGPPAKSLWGVFPGFFRHRPAEKGGAGALVPRRTRLD